MYSIAASAELGNDIARKEFRVTSRHIDIGIVYFGITVEDIFKFRNHLNFVEHNIVGVLVGHQTVDVSNKCIGITKGLVSTIFQVYTNNVVIGNAFAFQVLIENIEQQKRLP